jgi:hypothetical protein
MEKHEQVYKSRHQMMIDNFLGGISWSLGVVIGGAFVLAVLGFLISKVNVVPIVGDFVGQVLYFVETNQPTFQMRENIDSTKK